MSPPKFKLIYFNGRGRAELIRLVLHSVDQEFEDERMEFDAWPKVKPSIPGGKVPVLQVTTCCGKTSQLTEGWAIARKIARQHNMMGNTDTEYYEVECVLGQCEDLNKEMYKFFGIKDDEKAKILEEFKSGNALRLLEMIAKHLKDSKSGFVAGDKVTLADLALMCIVDQVETISPGLTKDKLPVYAKHREAVIKGHPKLAEYLKNRPTTPF